MSCKLLRVIFISMIVFGISSPVAADNSQGISINAQGTFTDNAAWMYKTPDGKYRNGPTMAGTNEQLVPDPPKPEPGESLVGITLGHHRIDLMGYPLHISLYGKLFANANKVTLYASYTSTSGNIGLWKYDAGTPLDEEVVVTGPPTSAFTATGPVAAGGPIPSQYQFAFNFAKNAISSIENIPAAQKDMSHYVVMFIETDNEVWVEFAPLLALNEAPHLGCQAQQGRDMVFGVSKKSPPSNPQNGAAFIQCF